MTGGKTDHEKFLGISRDKISIYIHIYIYIYIYMHVFVHNIFFIKNTKKTTEDDKQGFSFGLKSGRGPPQVKDLIQFDDNLVKIEKELKFRKVNNDFQKNVMWRCE